MRINLKKCFVDIFGNPVIEKRGQESAPQEMWRLLAMSLFSLSSLGGRPLAKEQKYMAYSMSRRMAESPASFECTAEEAAFLKDVCSETLSAGAYGQVVDLIESNNV